MRQFGIATLTIVYALAGLAVVSAVGGGVYSYNSAIRGKEKAENELKDCANKYDIALGQINLQNQKIIEWEKAAEEAAKRANDALVAAAKASASTQAERARLKRLQAEFKASGPCPAGQAVADVRKGLKP